MPLVWHLLDEIQQVYLLIKNLQTELNDAWFIRARDLTTGGCGGAVGAADSTRKVQVGVIEDVVEFGAKFYFETLDRSRKLLIEGKIVW